MAVGQAALLPHDMMNSVISGLRPGVSFTNTHTHIANIHTATHPTSVTYNKAADHLLLLLG